ncbi:ribonuclease T [Aureococcus anophagefferens]|uniref:Ribonuclease T n=1 Tax=Aureococcus anophagefferens TaxID=44056 RepID=A0ABR1GAT8_AURAN
MGLLFLRRAAAFHRRAAPLCRRAVLRASTKPVAIAYDLETTSAWPATAEVVQLAFTNVANSDEHFQALVLPEGGVDGGAAAVHGYTKASLKKKRALPFDVAWGMARDWLGAPSATTARPPGPEIADRVALEQFYRVECALRKVARGLAVTPPLDVPGNGTAVAPC